ncbi:hypothetical protein BN137_1128 [Cronobacter condimenti 1330]|uniref:Uncharacterized protein n=1 Tax=Cronobacter condimenti 1330 TaxID=1073999 RepID=K8ABZ3_9ENTR|nr:hypothetical protein BN137_1128 [Cronobacter condimenti 1330]
MIIFCRIIISAKAYSLMSLKSILTQLYYSLKAVNDVQIKKRCTT